MAEGVPPGRVINDTDTWDLRRRLRARRRRPYRRSPEQRDELTPSFDHLVGAQHERGWHLEADRLRGLQVDRQLEPRRLLDRDVIDLLAAKDSAAPTAGTSE